MPRIRIIVECMALFLWTRETLWKDQQVANSLEIEKEICWSGYPGGDLHFHMAIHYNKMDN